MRPHDPERVTAEIGRRIAELRRGRGWTQEKFSVALRVSFQWVSQLEAGHNATLFTLVKVANALEVPLSELFVGPLALASPRRRGRPLKRVLETNLSEGTNMRRFVAGKMGELRVLTGEPQEFKLGDRKCWGWRGAAGLFFEVVRGQMVEYDDFFQGERQRVYARLLPHEVGSKLDAIDAEMEILAVRTKRLSNDRQGLLGEAVKYGERIKVKTGKAKK